jgi:hypothetical protein
MATTAETTRIKTAANVVWSDSRLFDGWLCLLLGLPAESGKEWPSVSLIDHYPPRPIPRQVWIPVKKGVVQHDTSKSSPPVFKTSSIVPPGSSYYAYFYDSNLRLVAPASGTASAFAVTADETVISVPVLTVPSVSTASPPAASPSLPQNK